MFPPNFFANFRPEGGCSEGLDALRFFSNYSSIIVLGRGTGPLNPSRETKFSGANGGREIFIFLADHEQDWQPCPVDPYSATCDDHTYIPRGF